jgi:hypothetical protein
MASQVGLSSYKLIIKKKYSHASAWEFVHGGETDGFTEVLKYLQSRKDVLIPCEDNQVLTVKSLQHSTSDLWIDGLIVRGLAGAIQDIVNIETEEVTYRKSKSEAMLEPFYFRFQLENHRRFGVVLLQSFGNIGVKGALFHDFQNYLARKPEPLSAKLVQVVDGSVLERFIEEGKLQDIILVNRGKTALSRDVLARNAVGGDALGDEGDKLELKLGKKGGWSAGVMKMIRQVMTGTLNPKNLVKTDGMQEIDDLKVTLRVGNRNQTFSLLNPDDSPIRVDITDDVAYGNTGYPTIASLRAAAIDVYDNSIIPIL